MDIKTSIKSDHSAISLSINGLDDLEKGPNFWKFNPNLVNNSACCELLTTEYASRVEEFKEVQDKRVFERIPKSGKNIMFKIKPLQNVQNKKNNYFLTLK